MSRRSLGKAKLSTQLLRRPSEANENQAPPSLTRQSRSRIPKGKYSVEKKPERQRSNSSSQQSSAKKNSLWVTPIGGSQMRLSLTSSSRPSSVNGRESSYLRTKMGGIKDSRPLQDKLWQQTNVRKLAEFLKKLGYPSALTSKSFPLSATEFRNVFNFMFGVLSPGYVLPPKFESEIPILAKSIGYPGVLSKSSFITLGSLHSWPSILGFLSFLRVCIMEKEGRLNSQILFSNLDENGFLIPNVKSDDEIEFDFYTTAYREYGEDENKNDFQEELEMLRQNYLIKYNVNEDRLDKSRSNVAVLEAELNKIESEPNNLEKLQQKYAAYMGDYKILTEFIEKLKGYREKRDKQFKEAKEHRKKLVDEIEELSKLVTFTNEVSVKEAELESQRHLIKSLEEDIQILETEICKMEISISKLLSKGADFIRSFNRLVIEIGEPSQKLESFGKYDEGYLKEKHKLMGELLSSKTTECRQAVKEFQRLEMDLEALREESESKKSKLGVSLNELEVQKSELKKIQKYITEEDAALSSKLNYYRDHLLEFENHQSHPNLASLKEKLETLTSESHEKKNELEARTIELEKFFAEANIMVTERVKNGVAVRDKMLAKYKCNVDLKNKQMKCYQRFLKKQSAELDKVQLH